MNRLFEMVRMSKISSMALCASLLMGSFLSSCSDDDKTETIGITSMRISTTEDSYDMVIDETSLTIENSEDKLSIVNEELLKDVKIEATTTLGASLYCNDEIVTEDTSFDFSDNKSVSLTVKKGTLTKTYKVSLVHDTDNPDLAKGVKISGDITITGFPEGVADYRVVYLNGCFYANATVPAGDELTKYLIYKSLNGKNWEKVATSPMNAVGGLGATPIVYKNNYFLIGGGKFWGSDEDGVAAETTWGMLSINKTRIFESANGSDFEELDPTSKINACMYPLVCENNGTVYCMVNKTVGFGMIQNSTTFYKSQDGKEWESIAIEGTSPFTSRASMSLFSFKNKLYSLGGIINFISTTNDLVSAVYSSADGQTWEQITESTSIGGIFDATVVATDDYVYLFGGEKKVNDESGVSFELNNQVYRSNDCINWEEIEVNASYSGSRIPSVYVDENKVAWVFGGLGLHAGYYGYGSTVAEYVPSKSVWAFQLK